MPLDMKLVKDNETKLVHAGFAGYNTWTRCGYHIHPNFADWPEDNPITCLLCARCELWTPA